MSKRTETPLWPRGHLVGGRRVEHGRPYRHWRTRRNRIWLMAGHEVASEYLCVDAAWDHRFVVVDVDPHFVRHLAEGAKNFREKTILTVPICGQADADRLIPALLDCPARWRAVVLDGSSPVELAGYFEREGFRDHLDVSIGEHYTTEEVWNAIDLVIVAGQVGKGAAPCDLANVRAWRDQCEAAGVGFVIARLGSRISPDGYFVKRLRSRDGRRPDEWPADLKPYAAAAGPLAGGES